MADLMINGRRVLAAGGTSVRTIFTDPVPPRPRLRGLGAGGSTWTIYYWIDGSQSATQEANLSVIIDANAAPTEQAAVTAAIERIRSRHGVTDNTKIVIEDAKLQTPRTLPAWVKPVAIGGGLVVVAGALWLLLRRK